MTKITIQRTFDPAKTYQSEAGKQMKEFIESQLSVNELLLRTLLNGVSFQDNCYCQVKDLELRHNEPQTIGITKPVSMILVGRVIDKDYPLSRPLHWYYDDQNRLTVLAQFSPTPTVAVKVKVVLLFE